MNNQPFFNRRILLLTVLIMVSVFTLLLPAHAQEAETEDLITRIDTILNDLVEQETFSGAVLVGRGDDILLNEGYGMANIEWDVPNTPDSKFNVASITKQFTAAAILMLQEQGKLNLEDPICNYLEDCPDAWNAITIEQVLTHRDGIPELFNAPDPLESQAISPERLIALFRDKTLDFEPGKGQGYANSGYIVLGQVIETVSDQSYGQFLQENILQPLEMENTDYDNPDQVIKHRVTGYVNSNKVVEFVDPSILYAAGGLYSTTGDLFKWVRALFNGKVVSPETVETSLNNGYGLAVDVFGGRPVVAQNGYFPGFTSALRYFPDDDVTLIVLSNFEAVPIDQVVASIFNQLFGDD